MPINIDTGGADGALATGHKKLTDVLASATGKKSGGGDPRVSKILSDLNLSGEDKVKKASDTTTKGRRGVEAFERNDRDGAARTGRVATTTPVRSATGNLATTPSTTGSPVRTATPVSYSPMSTVAPIASVVGSTAGGVLVTGQQLAQLAAVQGNSTIQQVANPGTVSGTPRWDGDTRPRPIDVKDVVYEKQHGKLSPAQKSAVIDSAMDKAGITDPAARAKWKTVLDFMADKESGDNPSSVNLSDSNAVGAPAADGHPAQSSRGMWQTIPATFAANHGSGTSNNIYDPEASCVAAINYIKGRYNVGHDGSGLDAFYGARQAGGYTGY